MYNFSPPPPLSGQKGLTSAGVRISSTSLKDLLNFTIEDLTCFDPLRFLILPETLRKSCHLLAVCNS